MNGKRLLLIAEQGYGDTILAARFIPLIQQKFPHCEILLQCKPELHRLFAGLGVQLQMPSSALRAPSPVGRRNNPLPPAGEGGASAPGEGNFCPLMSLMGLFNINDTNVPPPAPLHIPEAAKAKFAWLQQHAPGKKKIGIVWSGSLTFKDNAKRAATLAQFLPLAENAGVQLYSFQKGPRQKDLHEHAALPLVCDLADQLEDFADTAAAVMHMDAIVMTDSSLAHLAASLHKPVINLLQYKPYWLYASDVRMQAWYPSMRAIRQEKAGDWETVFAMLRERLYKNCYGGF